MAPRKSSAPDATPTSFPSSPPPQLHQPGVQGHDYHLQLLVGLERSVSSLQTKVDALSTKADTDGGKLLTISEDVIRAKTTIKVVGIILGVIGTVIGTVATVLLNHIVDRLGQHVGR